MKKEKPRPKEKIHGWPFGQKDTANDKLRKASGTVKGRDPIASFFYSLMRDHMLPGDVENIVRLIEKEDGQEIVYSNGYLAKYAMYLSARLKKQPRKKKAKQ